MNLVATSPSAVEAFLRESAGQWQSQRRYYTLNSSNEPILEATSAIQVIFLDNGHPELVALAQKHQLTDTQTLICGAKVIWTSTYTNIERKPLTGETVFGIHENLMYRDRGFSTTKPVVAKFELPNPKVMRLFTAYDGSSFEEEIKLVGSRYRTRQTIISKAGQEIMIGQYLETRAEN
ncbi:MAG: phycobiliprotein lyase [Limnothrix sp.]